MDCNDTMTFFKERQRMCKEYHGRCKQCPAFSLQCALLTILCNEDDYKNVIDAVQKYSDESTKEE